ncbi:MAG: LacI family transcriptional regulator [Clostridiales bacterium]|nr:LacI family transcriptional regulator [Clostridiales bacterium]
MKITIKEIASMSEVSTATVSKVLSGKDEKISNRTRNRILKLAKAHNYIPNRIASSLVTKKTQTLGLIIPNIANPFFPEIARGTEDFAHEKGYTLILCNTDDQLEKEERYINMLEEKMVDGIIFTASSQRHDKLERLCRVKVPVIMVDREVEGLAAQGKVVVDNILGAYDAVKYLVELGYEYILHITGPMTSKPARDRLEGYKRALIDSGIVFHDNRFFSHEFNSEWGYKTLNQVIASKITFDAIFCGNDLIAIGVLKALRQQGLRVPEDVGLVGFDNIHMARMMDPELTTVDQPNYEMGYQSAKMLINMIENKFVKSEPIILGTKLIVRQSTSAR